MCPKIITPQISKTMENSKDQAVAEKEEVKKPKRKKVTLADFKVKSYMADVKVEQMQFLKTAGG